MIMLLWILFGDGDGVGVLDIFFCWCAGDVEIEFFVDIVGVIIVGIVVVILPFCLLVHLWG